MSSAQERIQQMLQRFEQQAAAAAGLKERMSEIRGEARSQDGTVAVTVAPSGAVLDLKLTPAAVKQSHTALQAAIMQTIRQATQQAADSMNATVEPVLGDRAEQFKEAMRAHGAEPPAGAAPGEPATPPPPAAAPPQTPPPAQQPKPSPGPAARRGQQDWDDDDFSGQSFLR